MQNDKALFAILVQADGFHLAVALRSAVAWDVQIDMQTIKAFAAMIAAAAGGFGILCAAVLTHKAFVDGDGFADGRLLGRFSGFGLLHKHLICGKIL